MKVLKTSLTMILLASLIFSSLSVAPANASHGGPETVGVNGSFTGPASISGVSAGSSFTVSIDFREMPQFNGYDIRIGFDPTALDATSVDYKACLGLLNFFILLPRNLADPEETAGVVRIALAVMASTLSGSGCLAKITFTALSTPTNSLIDVGLDNDQDPKNDMNLIVDGETNTVIPHDTFDSFVNPGPVTFALITDKDAYVIGEFVHAQLNATNNSSEPFTFTFPDSCTGFFFEISNSTGAIIFSNVPGPGTVCLQIVTTITIQPAETKTVANLDWNQVDNAAKQVPAGQYVVTGVFHCNLCLGPINTFPLASKTIKIGEAPPPPPSPVDATFTRPPGNNPHAVPKHLDLSKSGDMVNLVADITVQPHDSKALIRVFYVIVSSSTGLVFTVVSEARLDPSTTTTIITLVTRFQVEGLPTTYHAEAKLLAGPLFIDPNTGQETSLLQETDSRTLSFRVSL